MPLVNPGFHGRSRRQGAEDIPPGQYIVDDFPVLTAGQTPRTPLSNWDFTIVDQTSEPLARWTWDQFQDLPRADITADIHCVTKWTKLGTRWTGVSVDTLLSGLDTDAQFVLAFAEADYTTNLPMVDVRGDKAWVAFQFEGQDLAPEHGGPARLLVPHLYFWKSAKWVRGLKLMDHDQPGFWESLGYNNYGDPWREQRYQGD